MRNYVIFAVLFLPVMLLQAAGTGNLPDLLTEVAASKIPTHVTLPPQSILSKVVTADSDVLKVSEFSVTLPDNRKVKAKRDKSVTYSNGSRVWQGKVSNRSDSSVIFAKYGAVVAGVIHLDGKLYKLLPAGDGIAILSEFSPVEPRPEIAPVEADMLISHPVAYEATTVARDFAPSDDGSVIDVMVVYSSNVKASLYGEEGVNALIATAVAESNVAYDNSLITTQLNLVHTAEVANSSGSMSTDLTALQSTTDGVLDEVHLLRDLYGADMVDYLIINTASCGLAYVNTGYGTGDLSLNSAYAFSVVASDCATGYYSFAHELGHNMGCQHDPAYASSSGVYSYSYGYLDGYGTPTPDYGFRTIMAYPYDCNYCTRIQYFSNPNVLYNGKPTGIANEIDNARTINSTRVPVSQWRTSRAFNVVDRTVSGSLDDVDERSDGSIDAYNGLHNMGIYTSAMRFKNILIPYGATIDSAYIEFVNSSNLRSNSAVFNIAAEAVDSATTFSTNDYNVTGRTQTVAKTAWSVVAWDVAYAIYTTADISPVVQEVVDRPGWDELNNIAFIFNIVSGVRLPLNSDGGAPAKLHVEYSFDCEQTLALPQSQWASIAMACDPGKSTVADLFSDLPSGEYDTTWGLYEFNASNDQYRLIGIDEVPVEGKGYWFYTDAAGVSLAMRGKDNGGSDIPLVSAPGGQLNLVGNPHPSTFNWADVLVVSGGSTYTLDEANPALMLRTMYKWGGSAYQVFDGVTPGAEGTVDGFESFWVDAVTSGISLRIPSLAPAADAAPSLATARAAAADAQTPEGWYVRLIVESGTLKDPGNVLGQLPDSLSGMDRHDLKEEPPFSSPYLSIVFPHPLWEGEEWGYTTDYHALDGDKKDRWRFRVNASTGISSATLRWEGPQEILDRAVIIDRANGERIRLKKTDQYTFDINGTEHDFVFKLREKK